MRRMTCCFWLAFMILGAGPAASMAGQDPLSGPARWKQRRPSPRHRILGEQAQRSIPRAAEAPAPPAGESFIGAVGGMQGYTVSAAERERSSMLLRRRGDGGGGDVAGLFLIQERFLDSACGFPQDCGGPCNVVLMFWDESTENTQGVDILIDGQFLGTLPGLPATALPGTNGVAIFDVPAGLRVFRIADPAGATSDEAAIDVLDAQPFTDVSGPTCGQGAVAEDGTCEVLVEWTNGGPFADEILVIFDGDLLGAVVGADLGVRIPGAAAGEHCTEVVGISPYGDGSEAIYRGCFLETCCTVTCEGADCQPPQGLLVCQVAYGPADADNVVLATWENGEDPYAVGVNVLLDGAPLGTLAGDADLAVIDTLAAGPHEFGVQGDCGAPAGLSTIAEATLPVLNASPHPSPISGAGIACDFVPDPDGDGLETSTTVVTWMLDDPSNFIDVYVISGPDVFFIGTISGAASTVTVTNTVEEDLIALQFFATIDGNCYGSPIFECGPVVPPGNRYMQGNCNGTGTTPQITSAVFFLNYLFVGGGQVPPCLKACDANGDGQGNLTDAVYVLSYLFSGGPPPTLWVDSDADTIVDPTCTLAAPEDDCAASHEVCAG